MRMSENCLLGAYVRTYVCSYLDFFALSQLGLASYRYLPCDATFILLRQEQNSSSNIATYNLSHTCRLDIL